MPAFRPLAASAAGALLYAALALPANADALSQEALDGLAALREGDMVKLEVHAEPRPPMEAGFLGPDGEEMTLAAFEGSVVLMNFWATWCAPCRREMPSIDALARDMEGPDFRVLAVSTDFGGFEKPRKFLDDIGVERLEVYLDAERELARAAGATGLPVTLLLDREGREVARLLGDAHWDGPEAKAVIEHLVAATAPADG